MRAWTKTPNPKRSGYPPVRCVQHQNQHHHANITMDFGHHLPGQTGDIRQQMRRAPIQIDLVTRATFECFLDDYADEIGLKDLKLECD